MLNSGVGGVRDTTSAIISHEQTQTESAVFKLWTLYFQRISFQIFVSARHLNCNMHFFRETFKHYTYD